MALPECTCDTEILESPKTIHSFIDAKIKSRDSMGSEVPFCVANLDSIYEKLIQWQTHLPRVRPFYAVKCNNIWPVLRTLSALGTGFDCASKREMEMVMSLGVTPDRIIYAHTTKPQSHIRYAFARGVDRMTFDSEEELLKIKSCHPTAKLVLRIAVDDSRSFVKLNTKFGAKLEAVGFLLKRAQELHLQIIGVSFHVGSWCTDSVAFKIAIKDSRQVFDQAISMGFKMSLLDIGGGLNGKTVPETSLQQMSIGINEALDELFPEHSEVEIIAEPGRYFVDTAFTLAANIFAKKSVQCDPTPEDDRNGSDKTIMNYFISEGVYGCMTFKVYHSEKYTFSPHQSRMNMEPTYPSVIWGPTCDSMDQIADAITMPELNVGEWLLFHDIGAYSVAVAGDFNGFESAQVYPVVTSQTWKKLSQKHKEEN